MKLTRLCLVGMFIALGMASTALAEWGTYAYARTHAEAFNATPQTITDTDDLWRPHSFASSAAESEDVATGNIALPVAKASARAGDLSVFVDASTLGSSNATAEAIAEWKETFVFSVPNKPEGTQYETDFMITAHGTLAADATQLPPLTREELPPIGFPGADSGALVDATAQYFDLSPDPSLGNVLLAVGSRELCACLFDAVDSTDPFPSNTTAHWVLTNGEIYTLLFSLKLDLSTFAQGRVEPNSGLFGGLYTKSSATGDYSGSLHWGGLQSVRDAVTGELVTDWTITSESGFDYSKSYEEQVPEPSAIQLLAALVGSTLIGRRRHHSVHG